MNSFYKLKLIWTKGIFTELIFDYQTRTVTECQYFSVYLHHQSNFYLSEERLLHFGSQGHCVTKEPNQESQGILP